ncbi:hypothetical protein OE88DRAFT_414812 [Heliocybe sulcata]|uniref:Uncharacterized protein n=1 Tax=Heliocybe sulcata TaxID=5364 RepID=A0A5C3MVK2_9AGAM|nr:hypothetical protein OE88DRAFT_414812 [Heliocybe sulcata]
MLDLPRPLWFLALGTGRRHQYARGFSIIPGDDQAYLLGWALAIKKMSLCSRYFAYGLERIEGRLGSSHLSSCRQPGSGCRSAIPPRCARL